MRKIQKLHESKMQVRRDNARYNENNLNGISHASRYSHISTRKSVSLCSIFKNCPDIHSDFAQALCHV